MFFDNYPDIRLIDSLDTALSAKDIHDRKLKGVGAIASKLAAEKYKLEIIEESIETNKVNYTRFLILADKKGHNKPIPDANKSSICFDIAHQIGSLSKILSILSYYNINLTKIQSMPIMGKEWEYEFYVDVTFTDHKMYRQSVDAIKPFTSNLNIMGEYTKGRTVLE
jgi:prephenate dehydratase